MATGIKRVAVDLTLLVYASRVDFGHKNAQLVTVFYRLCKLRKLGVECLFVVDGNEKPMLKRDGQYRPQAHDAETGYCVRVVSSFIRALGWQVVEARGEAEAECALLNRLGVVDAVLTDDSDAFVFGATQLIRTGTVTRASLTSPAKRGMSSPTGSEASTTPGTPATPGSAKSAKDAVDVYSMEYLYKFYGLSQAGMRLMLLLAESDYGKGVPGIGKTIALNLACHSIVPEFDAAVSDWAATGNCPGRVPDAVIRVIETMNKILHGPPKRKSDINEDEELEYLERRSSVSIPTDGSFPSREMVMAIWNPETRFADGKLPSIEPRPIETEELYKLCKTYLGWSDKMDDKFYNVLQPAFLWMKVWRAVRAGTECDVFRRVIKSRTEDNGFECFIEWHRLDSRTLEVLKHPPEDDVRPPQREWISGEVLVSLAPKLFQQYQEELRLKNDSKGKTPRKKSASASSTPARFKQPSLSSFLKTPTKEVNPDV